MVDRPDADVADQCAGARDEEIGDALPGSGVVQLDSEGGEGRRAYLCWEAHDDGAGDCAAGSQWGAYSCHRDGEAELEESGEDGHFESPLSFVI